MTKDEAIDVIRDAGFCMFGTVKDNKPRVRPMMPYYVEETGELILALLGRSRTLTEVKTNPNIELCFVDRKMWYCRVAGQASISTDASKKEILWNNIPMLKQYFGGIDDANFHLITIQITSLEAMTPHQKEPENIKI